MLVASGLDRGIIRARDSVHHGPVLDELEGRHGLDLVLLRCLTVLVYIHLYMRPPVRCGGSGGGIQMSASVSVHSYAISFQSSHFVVILQSI